MMDYGWVVVIALVSMLTGFLLGIRVTVKRLQVSQETPKVDSRKTESIRDVPARPEPAKPAKPAKPVNDVEDDLEKIAVAIALAAYNNSGN
jgi:hypothetical protein